MVVRGSCVYQMKRNLYLLWNFPWRLEEVVFIRRRGIVFHFCYAIFDGSRFPQDISAFPCVAHGM